MLHPAVRPVRRIPRLRATLTIVAALASATPCQTPPGFADAWNAIQTELSQGCERAGLVGASIAFVTGEAMVALATHGFADIATERRVDRDTIFHWASCTKTLTGIATMQLGDHGKLGLGDPIVDHLPELRAVHSPFGSIRAVTVAHLLSHSGGFRGATWPWGGKDWHPHEPTSWSQLVAMMPYTEIEFAPGSRYSYSNPGIVFLGRVIEQLSGEDYETYMEKNVLRPLGMGHSYFDRTPYHLLRHRSNNYSTRKGSPVAGGLDFDTGITVSNGGLNAPLPDMARYLAFLLGAFAEDSDAAAVLSRATLTEMWQPRLPISEANGQRDSIGLTFFVMERGARRFLGHTGGQKSFVTFFYVHPESRTGGLGAFNTDAAGPLMARIRGLMMDTLTPLFVPR